MGTRATLKALQKYRNKIPKDVYRNLRMAVLEADYAYEGPFYTFNPITSVAAFRALNRLVTKYFGFEDGVIIKKGRKGPIVDAKTILIYETWQRGVFQSLFGIAEMFEGFNHVAVLYHLDRYKAFIENDKRFRADAIKITQLINKYYEKTAKKEQLVRDNVFETQNEQDYETHPEEVQDKQEAINEQISQ